MFVADQEDYHAFIEEREVLLQEGLEFEVQEILDESNYKLVKLKLNKWKFS